jgi:hypothetical protein
MTSKGFKRKLKKIRIQGERYKRLKALEEAYAEYLPERKERKTSTIMLVIIVASILLYTIGAFFVQYHTGVEISSTLTTCWFSFWGVEILALTGIRISKVFQASNKDEHSD